MASSKVNDGVRRVRERFGAADNSWHDRVRNDDEGMRSMMMRIVEMTVMVI